MGGGQARAPADDDHVPWSRPPGVTTVTLPVTARAGSAGSRNRSGPRPEQLRFRPRPEGGAGAKQQEAAEGLRKICQRAAPITMLRLKINDLSNEMKER
jgi:hypothetical protein